MNENLSLTHEELLICERLRSLRISGMADAFESPDAGSECRSGALH